MFFINEEPNVIQQDPARFFFPLHTIFMQHREAAEAGKLYLIATEKYHLPDDIVLSIQSDVLFALGCYDQVAPIYEKMKETSPDPVLDFYLAVSYLYLLDFEKAHQHLTLYESYFSHSPQKAQKVAHLRKLVDCFRNKMLLNIDSINHPLEALEWNEKLEKLLTGTQKNGVFLGVDTLYKLEKANKWDVLGRFNSISVCPLLISEIMRLYLQTGDINFYHAIMNLAKIPQIEIKSPELIYYLALDFSDRDAPSVMKMEQALLLQEQKGRRKEVILG